MGSWNGRLQYAYWRKAILQCQCVPSVVRFKKGRRSGHTKRPESTACAELRVLGPPSVSSLFTQGTNEGHLGHSYRALRR